LGKGKGLKNCFDVQSLLEKITTLETVLNDLVATINKFSKEHSQILQSFIDVSDKPDIQLAAAAQQFKYKKESIDAELEVWDLLTSLESKSKFEEEDDEIMAKQTMKIKW
jgi:hypothetical protein